MILEFLGGGHAREYATTVDKLLKQKSSVIQDPSEVAPHCLVIAMKVAILAMRGDW